MTVFVKPKILKTAYVTPQPDRKVLHEMACATVEETYLVAGWTEPTWLVAAKKNVAWIETQFTDPNQSKDFAAFAIRRLLEGTKAHAYSFICETWLARLNAKEMGEKEFKKWSEFATTRGVSQLPPHLRDDMAVVMTHDRKGGASMSSYLVTIRDKGLNFLGPRQDQTDEATSMSGRLFNLFEERKPLDIPVGGEGDATGDKTD